MFRTTPAPRSFKPSVEALEDRLVPAKLSNGVFFVLNQPLQQAVTRIHQLQAKIATDIMTMKTDADAFTFFTESQATQTKVDQDYATLAADVAQIHALDVQVHNEANAAVLIVLFGGGFNKKQLTLLAIQIALQSQSDADSVNSAVFAAAPVTASPIAGQSLAPQYPAFNTIPGFPG
jgi:hypothetical protein